MRAHRSQRWPFRIRALLLALAWGLASAALAGEVTPAPAGAALVAQADAAIDRGVDWLVAKQRSDGGWLSTKYGSFKDEMALTPMFTKVLFFAPATPARTAARDKAVQYIAGRVKADGTIDEGPYGLSYPVYSSALAAMVLSMAGEEYNRPRDAWLAYLRRYQYNFMTHQYSKINYSSGGWSYAPMPQNPSAALRDPDFVAADLSSTIFAVGALRFAKAELDDPALQGALAFIKRMQNLPVNGEIGDGSLGDGGFHFSPDPARNKAGFDDRPGGGRVYRSYGSATADGLRGLVRCGLPSSDPRVAAARAWLEAHFAADHHPGAFTDALAQDQEAFYFYWCWSVSHAFNALNVDTIHPQGREIVWADALAAALIRRQQADGTWTNPANFMREDDPMVATPLALAALLIDRMHMTGGGAPAKVGEIPPVPKEKPVQSAAQPTPAPAAVAAAATDGSKAWVWLGVGVALLLSVAGGLMAVVRGRGR